MSRRPRGLLYLWPTRFLKKEEIRRSDARTRALLIVILFLVGLCLVVINARGAPAVAFGVAILDVLLGQ